MFLDFRPCRRRIEPCRHRWDGLPPSVFCLISIAVTLALAHADQQVTAQEPTPEHSADWWNWTNPRPS
jgi:hypothetical protein